MKKKSECVSVLGMDVYAYMNSCYLFTNGIGTSRNCWYYQNYMRIIQPSTILIIIPQETVMIMHLLQARTMCIK